MSLNILLDATLLLRDLPTGSFVGIDLASFTSTPRFLGVQLIPPGLHFVYCSPSDASLRHGFWFFAAPGSVLAKKWEAQRETLVDSDDVHVSAGDDTMLTPYRQRDSPEGGVWRDLSRHISTEVLHRCLGVGWTCGTASVSGMDWDREEEELMGLTGGGVSASSPGAGDFDLSWSAVDLKKTWPDGTVGRQRTEMAKDRSWALDNLLGLLEDSHGSDGESQFLGELELAFVMAVTLGCYSAMEQYRRLLALALTCRTAVLAGRARFFETLMDTLLRELEYVDADFFAGFVAGGDGDDNWLAKLLGRFSVGLREDVQEQLEAAAANATKGKGVETGALEVFKQIESLVKRKFDWVLDPRDVVRRGLVQTEDGEMVEVELAGLDEEDETGEFAPVIVNDLGEEYLPHRMEE